ncbi:FAD/NAD-P-binding domain-containing protein [Vararia minispora EC-137]|uniref:FAD/NAD-P-binding domain-containing protein n=1 Tax=Vararia minispora EC-137 TaxID=1314806 RepID=A0ACB8QYM8_9AGAM|nr:FAD/NAD-P-binding domain-containing protein [Vararia minispora EC-137]
MLLRAARPRACILRPSCRLLHASSLRRNEGFDWSTVEHVTDDVDVCIVGAGPAGLSAAIRLKQLEQEHGKEIRVVVLEKGSEVGSHILSGAVIEPRALNELLPDWQSREGHPLNQPVTSSTMRWFTKNSSYPIPHPPQMNNKGNYIVSLSQVTAWLGSIAEELGVEIYPGFAGASLVYTEDGKAVAGVRTNDVGIDRRGQPRDSFEPGMEFRAKVTLLAEGARGSLTKTATRRFRLRESANADPQTYGFGVKEVWRVDPSQYRPGEVVHTIGWPLDMSTYGGGWVYHMADGLVSLGLVVGLDYANPYLSPFRELQRMKHHPFFTKLLGGDSSRIAYGARTLNEGGLQSVPALNFPGGALIGCSAGFVNISKIKGTHNAMKTGMLAAETAYEVATSEVEGPADMSPYYRAYKKSWVYNDLYEVRNIRPSFGTSLGLLGGIAYAGFDSLLRGRLPWTFRNPQTSDAAHTKRAAECTLIEYPLPQPPLSTDLMTALALTGTNHAEDQPAHLRVRTEDLATETPDRRRGHVQKNVQEYAGLLERACPAGVYEYVDDEDGSAAAAGEGWDGKKLVINAQVSPPENCIHCKLCDVKAPTQDIQWTVPEGGGGPKYSMLPSGRVLSDLTEIVCVLFLIAIT